MKYLTKSNIRWAFYLSIILGLVFIFILPPTENFNEFMFPLYGSLVMFLVLLVPEYIKRRRHKTIINSNKFKRIQEYFNLWPENIGDYYGLKGKAFQYFVRIYFDYEFGRNGGVIVMVYFKPPIKSNGELDEEYLDNIYAEHTKTSMFRAVNRYVGTSHFRITFEGAGVSSSRRIKEEIEKAESILMSTRLKPINEKEIDDLIKNDDCYMHHPPIETFKQALNHSENNYQNT